jgi:hypothetical protein
MLRLEHLIFSQPCILNSMSRSPHVSQPSSLVFLLLSIAFFHLITLSALYSIDAPVAVREVRPVRHQPASTRCPGAVQPTATGSIVSQTNKSIIKHPISRLIRFFCQAPDSTRNHKALGSSRAFISRLAHLGSMVQHAVAQTSRG